MKRIIPRSVVVIAALLATATAPQTPPLPSQPQYQNDPRYLRLRKFFSSSQAPAGRLAADFLAASDRYRLDWRLLPSLSVVESSGGKHCKKNNMFGWDSGEKEFLSLRHGIHVVASRLANSKIYRGKPLDEKLGKYNPNPEYPSRVKVVMQMIGPAKMAAGALRNHAGPVI